MSEDSRGESLSEGIPGPPGEGSTENRILQHSRQGTAQPVDVPRGDEERASAVRDVLGDPVAIGSDNGDACLERLDQGQRAVFPSRGKDEHIGLPQVRIRVGHVAFQRDARSQAELLRQPSVRGQERTATHQAGAKLDPGGAQTGQCVEQDVDALARLMTRHGDDQGSLAVFEPFPKAPSLLGLIRPSTEERGLGSVGNLPGLATRPYRSRSSRHTES